jgi:peptidylprolyl isomerase
MSRIASFLTVSLVALALAGCSAPGGDNCIPSGAASSAVKVDGEFGAVPTITFDKGLTVTTTERSVAIAGQGAAVANGDTVTINYTMFNGTTGLEIEKSEYTETSSIPYPIDTAATSFVGLSKAISCTTVGSRIVAVIPNAEGFGDQASQVGIGADETLVFVIDVTSIAPKPTQPLAEATGTPVEPLAGFPEVVFTDGNPSVTIPAGEVPSEYSIETLIQGDGDVVTDGATVVVNYEGVNWNTGAVFDSSFDRGEPATFSTSGVIQGFRDALVGQKVGSRVVVIIPSDLGYGDAGSGDNIKGGDTIVFVVDILGIQ